MIVMNSVSKKLRQIALGGMLVGVMSITLVACGGDPATTPTATATTPAATQATAEATATTGSGGSNGSATEASVQLVEWAVKVDQPDVPAGKVKFNVTNDGKFTHNYVILEGTNVVGRTPNFTSAENPQVIEVDLKPGEYTVLCDITGHPEQGMKGTLTVK